MGISIHTIALAALILTAGALRVRFGAKRVFLAGFAVFTVASLACALAPRATILIAVRAVQGVGAKMLCRTRSRSSTTAIPNRRSAVARWAGGWLAPASR